MMQQTLGCPTPACTITPTPFLKALWDEEAPQLSHPLGSVQGSVLSTGPFGQQALPTHAATVRVRPEVQFECLKRGSVDSMRPPVFDCSWPRSLLACT